MTYRDLLDAAMKATHQKTADECFVRLMKEHQRERPDHSPQEAERIQRANLGYYAGYYDSETRRRVERLYGAVHPIFGSIIEHGEPTPEMAFEIGRLWGGGSRN